MPPKPRRDYWDTNVFLALFQKGSDATLQEQREHSIRSLEDVRKGAAIIVTSAFTLAEARRGDGMPPLPGEDHATLGAFFKHSYIEVVPVDRAIAMLAADYGERFRLKPPDAVQLATAVRSKATRFLTWDEGFYRTEVMKDAPIAIEYPMRPPDPIPPLLEAIEAAVAADAQVEDDDPEDEDLIEEESPTSEADELADVETDDEAEESITVVQPANSGQNGATAEGPVTEAVTSHVSAVEPFVLDGLTKTIVVQEIEAQNGERPSGSQTE